MDAKRRLSAEHRVADTGGSDPAYARLAELLSENAGVDIERFRRSSVQRRMLRRMHRLGLHDIHAYTALLERDPSELATLVRELLTPPTSVFRDPEVYAALVAQIPQLLDRTSRPQLWVPACGSGEEVYSLAMLVAEAMAERGLAPDFLVFGTDVDAEALEHARSGHFPREAALRLPTELRQRYLGAAIDDGFQVAESLSRHCLFLQHDVLGVPPLTGIDLISCRNLLRYLELALQRRLLENLHATLQPGGLLLIGNGEAALLQDDLFSLQALAPSMHRRVEMAQVGVREPVPMPDPRREFVLSVFQLSSLPMALIDAGFQVRAANPALERMLEQLQPAITGRRLPELFGAGDGPRVLAALQEMPVDSRRELDVELSIGTRFLPLRLCLMRPAGTEVSFVAELHYAADQEKLRQALGRMSNRMSIGLSLMREGLIATDAQGLIIEMNAAAERLTGWSRAEAMGQLHERVLRLVGGSSGAFDRSPVTICLREGRVGPPQNSDRVLVARDGRRLNLRCSVSALPAADGRIEGALLVFEDCTQISLLSEELAYRTSHDPITGLLNRDEFERRINSALLEARRSGGRHLLCYIDLDQFKVVNDVHGHFAGDEMLRQVAGVFRGSLRPEDALARLGGDEFGVLLEDSTLEQGMPLLEGLLDAARRNRFLWEGQNLNTTASMGVVEINAYSSGTARVLSLADSACYAAKDSGRDRIRVAAADDESARRHSQMSLVSKIGEALDRNLFTLHYEDVVRTASPQDVVYRELLVRMRGDNGELQPPAEFIAAAERYYLMTSIDRWVVQAALSGIARRGADGVMYGINISGLSLSDEKFLNYVISRFDTYGVAPEQVCFEITETAAISHLTEARRFIEKLSGIGCRFALDDFGSGMASFSYLRNLPVHFIKIEGSFVRTMLANRLDRGMVEAINRIGHDMGLKTIAEHVEDASLIAPLHAMGVDWVQGHAIAMPRPFDELLRG
ncbi:MAG TPA: EAL domain-containing protein [Solimonas sp.]|nr:EAL domain-containing protein [Solimonas sp.]